MEKKIPKPEDAVGTPGDEPVVRRLHQLYADGIKELEAVRDRQKSQRRRSPTTRRSDRARLAAENTPVVRRLRELYERGMADLARRQAEPKR